MAITILCLRALTWRKWGIAFGGVLTAIVIISSLILSSRNQEFGNFPLAVSPDGNFLAGCCESKSEVVLWRLPDCLKADRFIFRSGRITCLEFSGDSTKLFLGVKYDEEGTIDPECYLITCDLETKQWETTFVPKTREITSLGVSPDCKLVAIGGLENFVTIIDYPSLTSRATLD